MKYLLDTDICIYIINKRPAKVIERLRKFEPGNLGISVITLSELQKGVSKSLHKKKNQDVLDHFISVFTVLSYEPSDAKAYGEIVANLEEKGQIIGGNDLFIAAHALSRKLTLVTNNEKEFNRVQGLKIENWAR
ncbi:MAG: type II toxin-antitoxin system VapC family toxin [Desulfobacterales bacterium]|nr:type II toxin-antitoxin system VapC family toxin [Desulfobacterales bacterium]